MSEPHVQSLPATRAEAIALGEKMFFPAEPCKHGHTSPRYTMSGRCRECQRQTYLEDKRAFEEARERKGRLVVERAAFKPVE